MSEEFRIHFAYWPEPKAFRLHECRNGHKWRAAVEFSPNTTNISGESTQFCPECSQRAFVSEPWTLEDGSPYPYKDAKERKKS